MREIKFRAWDKKNKVMHNNFQFIRSGTKDGDWIIFISDRFTLDSHDTNPFKNPSPYATQQLKITQFTGLKDKDGKEIYEGDIIQVKDGYMGKQAYGYTIISNVFYHHGAFYFNGPLSDVLLSEAQPKLDELKVIGNVYENPELLEGES